MKFSFLSFLFICIFTTYTQAQQSSVVKNDVIYVVGAVNSPSEVKLKKGMKLIEAIAMVGGISKNAAQTATIFRLTSGRKDRELIKVDLRKLMREKAENIMLQPFDIIEISFRKGIRVDSPHYSDYEWL